MEFFQVHRFMGAQNLALLSLRLNFNKMGEHKSDSPLTTFCVPMLYFETSAECCCRLDIVVN